MTIMNGRQTCYYCFNEPIISASGLVIKHNGVPVCKDHYPIIVNAKPVEEKIEQAPDTPKWGGLFGPYTTIKGL